MLARERRFSWANSGAYSQSGATTHIEKPRRSALPLQAVRHSILRVDLSKSYLIAPNEASRNGLRNADGNESQFDVAGERIDSGRMRRPPFEAVHFRRATSVVANHLPTDCEPLASGRRKRSFTFFSFEGRGNERPVKKHKPFDLNSNCASGGDVKSKRSREMVGRKFRRLDSLEESGVVTGDSLTRTQSHQVYDCEHGSGKWITASSGVREETRLEMLDGAVEVDSIKRAELRRAASRMKSGVHFSEAFSDDWTQEHLQEPRKIEKRRSLDELQAPLLSWARKGARSRCGVRIVRPGLENDSMVKTFEYMEDPLIPSSEALKSSLDSEEFKLHVELKERRDSIEGINYDNLHNSTRIQSIADNDQKIADTLVSPGNCPEQNNQDNHEEIMEDHLDSCETLNNVADRKGSLSFAGNGSQCARDRQTNMGDAPQIHQPIFDSGRNSGAEDQEVVVILENQSVTCKSNEAFPNALLIKPSFCGEGGMLKASVGGETGSMESCPVDSNAIHRSGADVSVKSIMEREILQKRSSVDADNLEEVVAGSHEHEIKLSLAEGRRCGLCGGGSDGEPPDGLLPVAPEHEKGHAGGGKKVHPLYSEWDAFSTEPGWLGPLLGPLSDRFGIAGVWVHQECAIWSPEVSLRFDI